MQTKQQIEGLLASAGVRPSHRLGQHFLIDLNLMRFLVDSAKPCRNDIVLEVGCGTGSLTEALAGCAGKVIAVEYDKILAGISQSQLSDFNNVIIINSDVLQSKTKIAEPVIQELDKVHNELGGRIMLVANLPYNVAGAVMANLIIGPAVADTMTVTVQREVADRCIALPGGNEYGTLSVLMAATGNVRMLRKLPPSVFWPRPQVNSAILSFSRCQEKVRQIHSMELFTSVLSLFMGHRRKMLKSCVRFAAGTLAGVGNWSEIFQEAFVDSHLRPEQLSAENYISIANICCEQAGRPSEGNS